MANQPRTDSPEHCRIRDLVVAKYRGLPMMLFLDGLKILNDTGPGMREKKGDVFMELPGKIDSIIRRIVDEVYAQQEASPIKVVKAS